MHIVPAHRRTQLFAVSKSQDRGGDTDSAHCRVLVTSSLGRSDMLDVCFNYDLCYTTFSHGRPNETFDNLCFLTLIGSIDSSDI